MPRSIKGASGGMIVEYDNNTPLHLDGDYIRDEDEQATYLRELLAIFTAEGVDTALFEIHPQLSADMLEIFLSIASTG